VIINEMISVAKWAKEILFYWIFSMRSLLLFCWYYFGISQFSFLLSAFYLDWRQKNRKNG